MRKVFLIISYIRKRASYFVYFKKRRVVYVVSGIFKILFRKYPIFSFHVFVFLSLPLFILRNEEAYMSISLDIAKFSSTGIDRLKWLAFSLFRRHYPNFATGSINAFNYGTNARPTFMSRLLVRKGQHSH